MTKIKFGVCVPTGNYLDLGDDPSPERQFNLIKGMARDAEDLGYDSIWLVDHLHTMRRIEPSPVFECWTTLAALAMCTERVKLGQLVTCNAYRNPALLAKITSMVDIISGGRLILGIGAGWYEHEHRGFGYDFPGAGERVARLGEALQIIKRMWTESKVDFSGKYYKLQGGINYPKPLQKPHPPILVGGGGEKLTLRLAAEHADIYNWRGGPIEPYARKLEVLRQHCRDVGRDYGEIEKSYFTEVIVAETEKEVGSYVDSLFDQGFNREYIGKDRWVPMPREKYLAERIIGTPEQCAEQIGRITALGATHLMFYFPMSLETRPYRLFAKKVMPRLS